MTNPFYTQPTQSYFLANCEPYYFRKQRDVLLVGYQGARVAAGPNGLVLQEGTVFISANDAPLLADTPAGRISISAHSNLYVQQHASGALIIANLGLNPTVLQVGRNGQFCDENIGPGVELIVADMYFGARELEEELGIKRNYQTSHCNITGLTFIKHTMLGKEIKDRERIVDCDPDRYPEHIQQRIRSIRQVTGHLLSKTPDAGKQGAEKDVDHRVKQDHADNGTGKEDLSLLPISFVPPPAAPSLQTVKRPGILLAHLGLADVSRRHDGTLTLKEGEVLLYTSQRTNLEVGTCVVSMLPETAVLVEKTEDAIKIRNIYETKANSVKIMKPGGHLTSLEVSNEIILSADQPTAMLALVDRVGRRKIRDYKLQSGTTLTRSEISLVSLLTESQLLQFLRNSKDNECRKLHKRLLKTAACTWVVTGNHQVYSTIHPEESKR